MSLLSVVFDKSAIEIGGFLKCECVGDPIKEVKTSRTRISCCYFSSFHNVLEYTKKRPTSSHKKAYESAEIT